MFQYYIDRPTCLNVKYIDTCLNALRWFYTAWTLDSHFEFIDILCGVWNSMHTSERIVIYWIPYINNWTLSLSTHQRTAINFQSAFDSVSNEKLAHKSFHSFISSIPLNS